MRRLASAAAFALLGTACTAIVAGQLKKYDDFKVSDSLNPNGDNTDPCALTAPDAANECSRCIAQNCAGNINYACPADGGPPKPWFAAMQDCAEHPYEGYSGNNYMPYDCRKYDIDAQPFTSNDDPAMERAALLCVRDHCLNSETPPCHQCVVGIEKPGSAGGYAKLEDTACGRCIRENCGALLVKCCDSNLPEGIENCAYTDDPDLKKKCHDAVYRDAGGPDAAPDFFGTGYCEWAFAQSCLLKCQSQAQCE
jgi:hypothetical protein